MALLNTYRKERHDIEPDERHQRLEPPDKVKCWNSKPRSRRPSTTTTECPSRSLEHIARFTTTASQLDGIVDRSRQRWRVRALDRLNTGPVMEDLEGRHGAHAVGAGNGALRIDVDLGEGDFLRARVLLCEGFKRRGNHLAGAAPVGVDWLLLVTLS